MANANMLRPDLFQVREVTAIPRTDEFYNMLYQRIYMTVGRFYFSGRFTMFINALPRRKTEKINRFDNVTLIYAGIQKQRFLLEGPPRNWKPELNDYWNHLDVSDLSSETAVVSSQLFKALKQGQYRLEDIEEVGHGSLKDYFHGILSPETAEKKPTTRQVAEYHILKEYFNIETDRYLSVPLIQFGEFDGIVHFVYSVPNITPIGIPFIGNLIVTMSMTHEHLMIDWDILGRDPENMVMVQLPMNPIYYDQINKNPILRELGFDQYYRKSVHYLGERIRLNEMIIHGRFYKPYLKTAIISIMIDSYAHNISAHSLVALNWWFKRRAENIQRETEGHYTEVSEVKEIIDENIPKGFDQDRLLHLIAPWLDGHFVKDDQPEEEDIDVVKYPGSLAREIQPLLKFLMQKGAFWSGIARDNQFGGESRNLFSVLWEEFINNPLYLGTIAKSEDIFKISVYITVYEPDSEESVSDPGFLKAKKVKAEGKFVEIDIKNKRPEAKKDRNKGYYIELPDTRKLYFIYNKELEAMSGFVHPGEDYIEIKALLEQYEAFFPGEVVGRHAFFTILENEIRNVKHFKGDSLRAIQENGLELNLSIQESSVRGDNNNLELLKIGVWIGTPTDLVIRNSNYLIRQKFGTLASGIMDDETFAPKLGGNYQDKICAAMLFNNRFGAVQNGDGNFIRDKVNDTMRDHNYYPWIIPATSTPEEPHIDFEINGSQRTQLHLFQESYNHTQGFFKKHFYIWKAADIKSVRGLEDTNFIWDNLARFKFVHVQSVESDKIMLRNKIRENGVIRIIHSTLNEKHQTLSILDAFKKWCLEWITEQSYSISFLLDGAIIGRFVFDRNSEEVFKYYNTYDLRGARQKLAGMKFSTEETMNLAHGGHTEDPNVLRYRSHGIFRKYFMKGIRLNAPVPRESTERLIELFEVLATKVVIVDNRIRHRIRNNDREEMFLSKLKLSFCDETVPQQDENGDWQGKWEEIKQTNIPSCHFLILHLSFIEKILLTKYSDIEGYANENIGLFIEKEILPLFEKERVPDNFILVITTGRGRTKWWSQLNEIESYQKFTSFTIFRPVESLISGVEDALGRKDDIELKYNLVKVLFGT